MIPSTIAALQFSLEIVIGMSSLADGQAFNEGFWISSPPTLYLSWSRFYIFLIKAKLANGQNKAIGTIYRQGPHLT